MTRRRALAITSMILTTCWVASTTAAEARVVTIGHSVRRRPIRAQVIGPNSAPRKILLVGCIHGNECAGIRILNAISRKRVPPGVQLWLVRQMNPDGTAFDTRQNADGVDLNRNFPFRWRPISDPTYDSGPRPLSEPESRAARRLIRRLHPAVTIWYHQHEDLVDLSGGDRGIARRYAQRAGLRATCLPFLPVPPPTGQTTHSPGPPPSSWSYPKARSHRGRFRRHLKAVRGAELGERAGSRSSCRG